MTGMEMLAHRFACPRCGVEAGARCVDVASVLHVERYDAARASVQAEHGPQMMPRDHFHNCVRCGQVVITRADPPICATCRKLDRKPQGESMRLFEPAPTQIPGQLGF